MCACNPLIYLLLWKNLHIVGIQRKISDLQDDYYCRSIYSDERVVDATQIGKYTTPF